MFKQKNKFKAEKSNPENLVNDGITIVMQVRVCLEHLQQRSYILLWRGEGINCFVLIQ